jgi:hypothetical protein
MSWSPRNPTSRCSGTVVVHGVHLAEVATGRAAKRAVVTAAVGASAFWTVPGSFGVGLCPFSQPPSAASATKDAATMTRKRRFMSSSFEWRHEVLARRAPSPGVAESRAAVGAGVTLVEVRNEPSSALFSRLEPASCLIGDSAGPLAEAWRNELGGRQLHSRWRHVGRAPRTRRRVTLPSPGRCTRAPSCWARP